MFRDVKLIEMVVLGTCVEYKCLNLVFEVFDIPKLNLSDSILGCSAFKEVLLAAESVSKGGFICPFFLPPFFMSVLSRCSS